MDADGNAQLTYKYNNPKFDDKTYAVSANGTEIKNQLSQGGYTLMVQADGYTEELELSVTAGEFGYSDVSSKTWNSRLCFCWRIS